MILELFHKRHSDAEYPVSREEQEASKRAILAQIRAQETLNVSMEQAMARIDADFAKVMGGVTSGFLNGKDERQ